MEPTQPAIQSVCNPVILFTQTDADKAMALITPKQLKNFDSILVVSAFTTPQDLPQYGYIQITQQSRNKKTRKEKVTAQWNMRIALIQLKLEDATKHVFRIDTRHFDVKPAVNGAEVAT